MAGELKAILLMFLLVGVVIVGCASFYGSLGTTYGVTGVNNISQFNSTGSAMNMSERMRNSVKEAKLTNVAAIDIPFMVISGGYNALLIVFDTTEITTSLFTDLATFSGLPVGWVMGIIFAIVATIIVFAILSALLKWEL